MTNTGSEIRGDGSPEERPRKAFIEELTLEKDFEE